MCAICSGVVPPLMETPCAISHLSSMIYDLHPELELIDFNF